ncbi:MAG: LacI family transcriptional regulator [Oscillochloris sp.]|nr:LacI family transcriptional regulator [Oscillochloris sp.]
MPKVTIIDIARRAGVGVGTASRALNNSPDVRPATRERVMAAAVELNYHPSAVARRLQGRRSSVIAFVHEVGDEPAGDMHFKDFISVLARSCARQDLDLLIHPIRDGDEEFRQSFVRLLRGGRADGLILADTREDDLRIAFLSSEDLPFVAFGRTRSAIDYPYVDLDSQAGSLEAVTHLIEQGRRRIGFIGLPLHYNFAQHRFAGYQQALESYGLKVDPQLVSTNLHTETETRAAVQAMLNRSNRPDAIAAATDLLAIYALRAIEDAGLIPGRDVAVVGFDDLPLAAHTRPSLTTVRQPFDLICDLLISTLIGVIEDDSNIPRQALVRPTLVVRESSAPSLP